MLETALDRFFLADTELYLPEPGEKRSRHRNAPEFYIGDAG
jgi:hypothetical protein